MHAVWPLEGDDPVSSTARNAVIGLAAALIAVLLVATGFLARVATEPEAEASAGTPTADGQLEGMPSVMFDAVAVLLSDDGAAKLAGDAKALDFVRDAFAHLKAIAVDQGGKTLLQAAGVQPDAGVVAAADVADFIAAAKTRQWDREAKVRVLP